MQNGSNVAKIQKPLRENLIAILFDESNCLLPRGPVVYSLQNAQTQRAAMAEPTLQKRFA